MGVWRNVLARKALDFVVVHFFSLAMELIAAKTSQMFSGDVRLAACPFSLMMSGAMRHQNLSIKNIASDKTYIAAITASTMLLPVISLFPPSTTHDRINSTC
jgi:hypothetical protein